MFLKHLCKDAGHEPEKYFAKVNQIDNAEAVLDEVVDNGVPAAVVEALAKRGHHVEQLGDFADAMGTGQAVMRDDRAGVNYGASDPRADGQAIAEMP